MTNSPKHSEVAMQRTAQSTFNELVNSLNNRDIDPDPKRGIYLFFILANVDCLNTLVKLITNCFDSEKGCFEIPVNKESEYQTLLFLRFGIIKKIDKIRIRYEFVDVNKFIQVLRLVLSTDNLSSLLLATHSHRIITSHKQTPSARSIDSFLQYLVNFIKSGAVFNSVSESAITHAVKDFNQLGLLTTAGNDSSKKTIPTTTAFDLIKLIVQIRDIYVADSDAASTNPQRDLEDLKELMIQLAALSAAERTVDIEG